MNPTDHNHEFDQSSQRLARKYYLHHQCRITYPIICTILTLSILFTIAGLTSYLGEPSWLLGGFLIGFPCALLSGFGYYQMNRAARYFAGIAISEGNYTAADIASFYESCYIR